MHSPANRLTARRPGRISLWLLLAMFSALLPLKFLAVNSWHFYENRNIQQNAVDAAALAAAETLVDDRLLIGNSADILTLTNEARAQARAYITLNPLPNPQMTLQSQLDGDEQEDVIFGYLAKPSDSTLVALNPVDPAAFPQPLAALNTVFVRGVRSQARGNPVRLFFGPLLLRPTVNIATEATVTLDRFVVGIQGIRELARTPLAPIALFSDPSGAAAKSWENQIEDGAGSDVWQRTATTFVPGSDGLFEMTVTIGSDAYLKNDAGKFAANVNAALLQIGSVPGVAELCAQIENGVSKQDLLDFGQPFVLAPPDNELIVPGTLLGPDATEPEFDDLQTCLQNLQASGAPRIWPLFSGFDSDGHAIVNGFVAARVVDVQVVNDGVDVLKLTLQPTLMSSPTTVTDPDRTALPGQRPILNPFVTRVRFVK